MKNSAPTTRGVVASVGIAIVISACGCVSANARNDRHPTPSSTPVDGASLVATKSAPDARIQVEWQAAFLDDLAKRTIGTEVWGLFSSGGWGDDGQTVVIRENGKLTVFVVPLNTRDHVIPAAKDIADGLRTTFESAIGSADNLEDSIATAFDALEYEYMHARVVTAGKAQVIRRMRFNFVEPQTPAAYTSLRSAFKGLR